MENQQLIDLNNKRKTVKEISKIMNRSASSITNRKAKLGIKKPKMKVRKKKCRKRTHKRWSNSEIELLTKYNNQNLTDREIAKKLRRTLSSISTMRRDMGLKKPNK